MRKVKNKPLISGLSEFLNVIEPNGGKNAFLEFLKA